MGFDNECIVNIQSLAGEYFCPVCRLLVFPNEALQSQCTHLYCKPCLTYVVSTTKACPYDGYLVTEADSKPLTESNKTLAETIGKITVHCLYHRSGCTWQGTLSECTSHCSGCAFGNSPVVCNRCGIQIVHRQVQEHAQNCPGVQGQAQQVTTTQDASTTSVIASTDQNQNAAPVAATTAQAAVSTTTPGQVSNQQPNLTPQTQALVQTAGQPTAEQWYQQQQYQQYYQQYPGQDPYQQQYQHYYPYQQSMVPQYQQAYSQPQPQSQSQPQAQLQPQPQPQAQHQSQQPQLQQQPQAQSQPLSHIQAPVVPPSQNQMQVQQQPQQLQPAVQPHGQTSHAPGHSLPQSQTQPYPYPQVQLHSVQPQPQQPMQIPPYQQPLPQMQHSQPQIQQPIQKYPVPQSQVHAQLQPNAPVQHPSQLPMPPPHPVTPNVQPQVQNAATPSVTGHHSYPQPLPHPNMQPGVPQHPMHGHPQSGPQPHAQHPVQMQNQFPPQIPTMRPNQSHAMFPNQQSSVQGQTTPPLQQQPVYSHNQQPGQINQRPTLQPVQQIPQQQAFAQHQMPMPSHLRPPGPAHSFAKHVYPQPQGNIAPSNNIQQNQSQNAGGRPLVPNHAGHLQPFAQSSNTIPVRHGQNGAGYLLENQKLLAGTNNQVQLPSELQSRAPETIERHGDVVEQQIDSATGKLGKSFKDLDSVSGSTNELKSEKFEANLKPAEVGNILNNEDPHSIKTSVPNANAVENGDSVNKNLGMGAAAESTWKPSVSTKSGGAMHGLPNDTNEHSVQGNEFQEGHPPKTETKLPESETDKLQNDDNSAASNTQSNGGFAQLSHSAAFTDQSKHQQPMTNYGPSVQQRSSAMLGSQLPHPTIPNQPLSSLHSSALVRNHGSAHDPHTGQPLAESFPPAMFKQPQDSDITPGRSFQPQSLGPPQPFNQVHEPPFRAGTSNLSRLGGPQFGAPLPGDMHGRMAANIPPHGPEGFGLHDDRFKPFLVSNQQNIDKREYDDDLKKFSRLPLDAESISKFGNYPLSAHESGKRSVGIHDDVIKKSGSTLHPGYLGPGPGYGRHHMDGMTPRSPVGEYAEMSSRRLGAHSGSLVGKSGIDDFDGRVSRHFGGEFRDSRFPHLPSHLRRDEFDGFGNFRMGEHPRSGDFIGQDEFAGHFRRGDPLGPHNFPRHLQLGEPVGFGAHPGHMRAIEHGSFRSFESFAKGNRSGHPQLGEPGFRSSFSLPGFPNDAGFLTGDIRSFDNLRRRKTSMGWCRICKVDCETVEGLDLHSQTKEHQKMAMDMVKTIKQNAKKQKLIPSEQPTVDDGNKAHNTGFEGRGNKH